jgi:hypothetical protein
MGRIKSKHVELCGNRTTKIRLRKNHLRAPPPKSPPFLMADGATLTFVARKDGKVRGSPSWHKTVVPFASGQFYTDSGRLTDALFP